jgi:hypothetical protein
MSVNGAGGIYVEQQLIAALKTETFWRETRKAVSKIPAHLHLKCSDGPKNCPSKSVSQMQH